MPQLIVSLAARADVRRILDHLEAHAGARVALRYALDFDAAFDRLAKLPGIGSPRPGLGPGVCMVVIHPYLIFYETGASGTVHVLRVLHGRRNITAGMIGSR